MHLTQRKHGGEVVSPLIPANPSDLPHFRAAMQAIREVVSPLIPANPSDLPHFRAAMQAIPDMALGLNVGKKGKLIKYFMQ